MVSNKRCVMEGSGSTKREIRNCLMIRMVGEGRVRVRGRYETHCDFLTFYSSNYACGEGKR
jgi:hypothetical protein